MKNDPLHRLVTPLRVPPPDFEAKESALERALEVLQNGELGAPAKTPRDGAPGAKPAWTWTDWLWPSPYAWGAMAAVWLIFFAVNAPFSMAPSADDPSRLVTNPPSPATPAEPTYFAYNDYQTLLREFAQLSRHR